MSDYPPPRSTRFHRVLACMLISAFLPTVSLGNEPSGSKVGAAESTPPLPRFPGFGVGDVSYAEVALFGGWLETDPDLMKARVEGLLERVQTGAFQNWRSNWLTAWSYEVDMIRKLTPDARDQFVVDIRRAKVLLLRTFTEADREPVESEFERCTTDVMKVLDAKCPSYILMLELRAYVKSPEGITKESQDRFLQIREMRARILGTDNPMYASDTENIAACALELGDLNGAREGLTKCLEIREKLNGVPAALVQQTKLNLSAVDVKSGRYKEAISTLTEILFAQKISPNQGNLLAAACYHHLGIAFAKTARFAEAEEAFENGINEYRKMMHPAHPTAVRVMEDQTEFFEAASQPEKAKEVRAKIESLKTNWKGVGKQA